MDVDCSDNQHRLCNLIETDFCQEFSLSMAHAVMDTSVYEHLLSGPWAQCI